MNRTCSGICNYTFEKDMLLTEGIVHRFMFVSSYLSVTKIVKLELANTLGMNILKMIEMRIRIMWIVRYSS